MESILRCNRQAAHYCRAPLTDRAVVTTCSHIFCLDCANELGLGDTRVDQRQCPTCGSSLPNRDDAVTTFLKPSEDYKTSVLSGLDPNTIMECAGRALAFWTYQTSQEIFYQEFMSKNLTEKYASLSTAMDKLINEANSEIQALQGKIGALHVDQKSLQQKNAELIDMYRDKSKKHTQTQYLYDTLKKKVMQSRIQTAASDTVNQTLHSIGGMVRPGTYNGTGIRMPDNYKAAHGRGRSIDSEIHRNGVEQLHRHQRSGSGSSKSVDAMAMPPPGRPLGDNRIYSIADATPTMHRTQLPSSTRASVNRSQIPLSTSRSVFSAGAQNPPASKLRNHVANAGNSNRHAMGSSNGYGISAGIKVGRAGTSEIINELRPEHYGGHRSGNNTQISDMDDRRTMPVQMNGPFYRG